MWLVKVPCSFWLIRDLSSQMQKPVDNLCCPVDKMGQRPYSLILQLVFSGLMLSPSHKWGGKPSDLLMQELHGLYDTLGANQACAINMEHLSAPCTWQRLLGEEQNTEQAICCYVFVLHSVLDHKVTLRSSGAVACSSQELTWSLTGWWGFLSKNLLIKKKHESNRGGLETEKETFEGGETKNKWETTQVAEEEKESP